MPSIPTAPPPPAVELQSPEAWAKKKNTPAWLLDAARARRLSNASHPQRASWLENGQLSEADFDATLDETLNGSLR